MNLKLESLNSLKLLSACLPNYLNFKFYFKFYFNILILLINFLLSILSIKQVFKWLKSIFKTSIFIALSKFIGFFRDLIVSALFGTSMHADAFNYACLFTSMPFILLGGLNGPFHSATVSALAQENNNINTNTNKLNSQQNSLVLQALFWSSFFLLILSIIFLFGSDKITEIIFKNNLELAREISLQTKIMLPALFFSAFSGILFGVSCFYNKTLIPTISPLINSIILIIFIFLFYKNLGILCLSLGVSAGVLIQALTQVLDLKTINFKLNFKKFFETDKLNYFKFMLFPALLSSTFSSLNVYIDMFFCSSLPEGSWTAIIMGNRLIQLPFGILTGASLVSFLPRITAVREQLEKFKITVGDEILNLNFLLIPLTAIFCGLSKPIVQILLQRGNFTAQSTELVSSVLFVLSFSILTALPREILTRAFYGLGNSKTPFYISCLSIIWNFILNSILVVYFGILGIAYSKVISSFISSAISIIILRKKIEFNFFKFIKFLFLGFLVYFLSKYIFSFLLESRVFSFLKLFFKFLSSFVDLEVFASALTSFILSVLFYILLAKFSSRIKFKN